jgi:nitrogenase iron protein NifH
LGDVVCGGFAQPIRHGYAQEIYLICSGGFMSIYAANNIAKAVQRLARRGDTGLSGIICNSNGDENLEKKILPEFAQMLGSKFTQFIPRTSIIQACEMENRAVVEHSPQSEEADIFRELAQKVMENDSRVIPTPVEELRDLERMYRRHFPIKI